MLCPEEVLQRFLREPTIISTAKAPLQEVITALGPKINSH